MQLASYPEGGPQIWMMTLHMQFLKSKTLYDDDKDCYLSSLELPQLLITYFL